MVATVPAEGKRLMEKWLSCNDRIIRRVMQENLKKKTPRADGLELGGEMARIARAG
jgi:hypothetical protein